MNDRHPEDDQQEEPDDQELLVAYLDGELTKDELEVIEKRLANEPSLSQRLEALRDTWQMLDELPSTPVDLSFTRSTMEMVALQEKTQRKTTSWKKVWIGFAAMGLALVAGFSVNQWILWQGNQQTLQDLPALQHLEALQAVGSESWLNRITAMQHWDVVHSVESIRREPILEITSDRLAWLDALPEGKRRELAIAKEQLQRLPPPEQSQIRTLAQTMRDAQDSRQWEMAVTGYGLLLKSLTTKERARIADLPEEERAKEIQAKLNFLRVNWYAQNMGPDDKQAIRNWAQEQLRRSWSLPRFLPTPRNASDEFIAYAQELIRSRVLEAVSALSDEDVYMLEMQLSATAQEILQSLSGEERDLALFQWLIVAGDQQPKRKEPTWNELFEVYQQLADDSQEAIDLKDPVSARKELARTLMSRKPRESGSQPPPPTSPPPPPSATTGDRSL